MVRPEVVTPLADAVRLIDHHAAHRARCSAAWNPPEPSRSGATYRRLRRPAARSTSAAYPVARRGPDESRRRETERAQAIDLVLHQGDEGDTTMIHAVEKGAGSWKQTTSPPRSASRRPGRGRPEPRRPPPPARAGTPRARTDRSAARGRAVAAVVVVIESLIRPGPRGGGHSIARGPVRVERGWGSRRGRGYGQEAGAASMAASRGLPRRRRRPMCCFRRSRGPGRRSTSRDRYPGRPGPPATCRRCRREPRGRSAEV